MVADDLIVFDTCTLPEYYDDVHKILSLPPGHIVTYDYKAQHIERAAQTILNQCATSAERPRILLAYIQARDYKKGDPSSNDKLLPEDSFVTLTRLAELVAIRTVGNDEAKRYYLDLRLRGYPFDRHQTIAKDIAAKLHGRSCVPMKTYIAVCSDNASDVLFSQGEINDQAYSSVVDALSASPSQFYLDTFWRIYRITCRTKPFVPFRSPEAKVLLPHNRLDGDRTLTYLSVPDQSTIFFHVQFHRGEEHGSAYRIRKFQVEISPRVGADVAVGAFATRSFGRETVAINVPATSSLSIQDIRYQFQTVHHDQDERKDYAYGPFPAIAVQYRKALARSILAIALICAASGLFAWAGFSTSVVSTPPVAGATVSIWLRTIAIVIGVLTSLYAYYLWNDEVSLDRSRRS